MHLSWLSQQDSIWIILVLLAAMLLAAEVGYLIGRRLQPRTDDPRKSHFSGVQGSLLGLLALLLAFTFGAANQRYETRRQLVVDDANALATLYWRSTMLPHPQQQQFQQLLHEYVNLRTDSKHKRSHITLHEIDLAFGHSQILYDQMWNIIRGLAQQNPPEPAAENMITPMIDASIVNNRRLEAFISRVPDIVIWLLLLTSMGTLSVIGFSAGLGNHRGIPARLAFTILVCGTIYVVLDFDRPLRGLIQVDQSPLVRLKEMLDKVAPPAPPIPPATTTSPDTLEF